MPDLALTPGEIGARLKALPAWALDGGVIRRTFKTDGWRGSMLVANAIAFICESADHHADLTVTWPSVSVALSTHSAGGITAKDLEVAGLIERQVTWKPGAGSTLKGPDKPFVKE
ncbi:MAG TPA: 4a-hydroxytetrahydrobiopterin dehydratase [Gemmatimonadales bacterium]|nr:4a-hydroxytetrahydrobiopterin dehydratase [Gemmatimonadales bacterium]